MNNENIQLTAQGRLRHFIEIEGLSQDILYQILDTANSFVSVTQKAIKSVPLLRGRTVVNLFFEPSTRTRTSFELAAKRLSADLLNMNIATSSTIKGESLLDTVKNIEAMQVDMFVIRHRQVGAAKFAAENLSPQVCVLNAGDGAHAHPTQAMLDMYTIQTYKKHFDQLSVAIIGDVAHSRVARSQIKALQLLGTKDIRIIAPDVLISQDIKAMGVTTINDIKIGLAGVDVVMTLRMQQERMSNALLPSAEEFYHRYGLTAQRLTYAKPDAIVMHPGPINRGVEIDSEVADGPQSVILQQVTYGVAVRMAVMAMLVNQPVNCYP